MREIDRRAIEEYGIPSILLMENAGIAVMHEVIKILGTVLRKRRAVPMEIAIFTGKGNNGGDGFVAARHLFNRGHQTTVFFFQQPSEMKPDPLTNFRILEKMNVRLVNGSQGLDAKKTKDVLANANVIVDAIFGTGLSKPVEDPLKTAIELINESKLPVVAVDIPSGLHADTGEVMAVCVKAKVTVTLGLPKKGFILNQAERFTGKVIVADISIPQSLLNQIRKGQADGVTGRV